MGKTPWRLMDCRGQHDVAHPTASRIVRLRSSDGPQFGSPQAPTPTACVTLELHFESRPSTGWQVARTARHMSLMPMTLSEVKLCPRLDLEEL
jgi:hypothetical protein